MANAQRCNEVLGLARSTKIDRRRRLMSEGPRIVSVMLTCQVRACNRTDLQPIREANVTLAVCADHSLAIRGGEQHTYLPDSKEVLVGPHALPELLNVITTLTVGNESELVEMHLGRNGVVEQKISFQVSDETKRRIGTRWLKPERRQS